MCCGAETQKRQTQGFPKAEKKVAKPTPKTGTVIELTPAIIEARRQRQLQQQLASRKASRYFNQNVSM